MILTTIGGVITLTATAITAAALIYLHVVPSGLGWRNPVSQFGITRYRVGYRIAAMAAAAAAVGAILALLDRPGFIVTVALLALFAVARFLIPFVPMDAPGSPTTTSGRWHNVLAFVAFGSVTAAAFTAGGLLHDTGSAQAASLSTVLACVMAVGAVLLLLSRVRTTWSGIFGIGERIIYLGFIAWFTIIGLTALGVVH